MASARIVRRDFHGAGNEVVDQRNAFRVEPEGMVGRQDKVVGDHQRTVLHLAEDVLTLVVVEKIARDLGALCHPIQPDSAHVSAMINVIVGDHDVDRAVELDAGHFRAAEEILRRGCRESRCRSRC